MIWIYIDFIEGMLYKKLNYYNYIMFILFKQNFFRVVINIWDLKLYLKYYLF